MLPSVMPVQPESDAELLARFQKTGSEAAFRALVEKYLGMVFGLALRRTGERALAEEVSQNVFTALARRASRLEANPTLAGWLYRCTMFEAASVHRREYAHQRKMKAFSEHTQAGANGDNVWREALPLLDEAIDGLSASERNLILLRFFEQKNFADIGSAVGKSGEAARKQCDRALEKLSRLLTRKGVAVPVTVLAAGLAGHLAQAAPAGLAWTISNGTLAGVSTLTAKSLILKTIELMAHTKTKAAVIVALAALLPIGLQWRQNRELKRELAQLRQPADAPGQSQVAPSEKKAERSFASRRNSATKDQLDAASMATAWEKALLEPDPLRRSQRIAELLATLSADKASAVAEVFEKMTSQGHKFDSEYRLFLRTWGTLDGAAAVAYAWEKSGKSDAARLESSELGAVVGGWASIDPTAAKKWIDELPDSKGKETIIYALIDGWSLRDFDAAAAYAASRPRSEARDHFRALLLERALAAGGIPEAQRWFNDIPSDDHNQLYKQRSFDEVIRAMLYRDPSAAAQWISANAGSSFLQGEAVAETAKKMAQDSPTETLRWLQTLQASTPAQVEAGARSVMDDWSKRDATAAGAYLQQQANNPAYDAMADSYARGIVSSDPANAFAWAQTLHDQSQRDQSLMAIAASWLKSQPDVAATQLRSAGYTDDYINQLSRMADPIALKLELARLEEAQARLDLSQTALVTMDQYKVLGDNIADINQKQEAVKYFIDAQTQQKAQDQQQRALRLTLDNKAGPAPQK